MTKTWRELFPNGRDIFYEGDDPEGFVETIKAEFGFDPSADPNWGVHYDARPGGNGRTIEERLAAGQMSFTREELEAMPVPEHISYQFHCPAEHLDSIYGVDRFPMGS